MLRRGNWNVSEEDSRAGPTTEREGHAGTLGSIHLDTPSPTPAMDTGEMVLKDLRSGVRIRVMARIQVSSANVAMRVLGWDGMSAVYTLY
jgi:hypothetical protein